MALNLGSTSLGKILLGSTLINKIYHGAVLVSNPITGTGTPVLSDFAISNAEPTKVTFNSSVDCTGMTTTGFVISGKTISSVTINSGGLSGYFTVSSAFTFWDNNTIRLGENDDTSHSQSIIYNFTLEYITNNIDEPTSTNAVFYVDGSVTSSGDGSTEALAFKTIGESLTAVDGVGINGEGSIVYVKSYSVGYPEQLNISSLGLKGTIDNPIKLIGYKTTIGDLDGVDFFTWSSTQVIDKTDAPTLNGSSSSGFVINDSNEYLIIRNFQAEVGNLAFYNNGGNDIIFDNVVGRSTNTSGLSVISTDGDRCRVINSIAWNGDLAALSVLGGDYVLVKDCEFYSRTLDSPADQDYFINAHNMNNSIIKNILIDGTNGGDIGGSHSISLYGDTTLIQYNLVEDCESIGTGKGVEIRSLYCGYNVIRNLNSHDNTNGINMLNGAHHNIIENSLFTDNHMHIYSSSGFGEPSNGIAFNNTFKNCIFDTTDSRFWQIRVDGSQPDTISDIQFINCTINSAPLFIYIAAGDNPVDYTNVEFINCIIEGVASQGDSDPEITFDYTNINDSWATSIGTNSSNEDPLFVSTTDFEPQEAALLTAPKTTMVAYDYESTERASTTTIGAINHVTETPQETPQETPLLSNFNITDAEPSRVYFDASSDIASMATTGFVISGKTTSSLTIDGDGLGGYFTVSTPFTFWDNNTIRLGENDDTTDSQTVLHNFTLEHIDNQIDEPNSFSIRYVTVTGAGLHDGTSEADAWDLSEMVMVAGRTIYIKAGDYVTSGITLNVSGYADGACKLIGYKTTANDIVLNYYSYGDVLDSSEMPLFDGSGGNNIRGLFIDGADNIIVKNIQFKDYGVLGTSNNYSILTEYSDNIVLENINSTTTNRGIFIIGSNTRIKNSIITNSWEFNFYVQGNGNSVLNNESYCDLTSGVTEATDYYYNLVGNNNIVKGNYAKRVGNALHYGHGIDIYDDGSGGTSNYNLIENHTTVNILQAAALRHTPVEYNVIRNLNSYGEGTGNDYTGGIILRDGTGYNIIENCDINLLGATSEQCVYFQDQTETGTGYAHDNIFRNNIFRNSVIGIGIEDYTAGTPTGDNNQFYNNTFHNIDYLVREYSTTTSITNTLFTNNIFNDVTNEYWAVLVMTSTWDYNNFYNGFAAKGTNTSVVNPDFVDSANGDFEPQGALILAPVLFGVDYDYNDAERAETTTIGAVKSVSE